jgi:hypothetical protein
MANPIFIANIEATSLLIITDKMHRGGGKLSDGEIEHALPQGRLKGGVIHRYLDIRIPISS